MEPTQVPEGHVMVRIGSHRARKKVEYVLGYRPTSYYSMFDPRHLTAIPADKLEECRKITGVTKVRTVPDGYQKCIPW